MYRTRKPRRPSDNCQTPRELAAACCQRLSLLIPPPEVVIEPSAGVGAFVAAVREQWPYAKLYAVETREQECREALLAAGASNLIFGRWEDWVGPDVPVADLIIGNPPYEFAQEHIELALQRVRSHGLVAFLLRMAFLNAQERVTSFWDKQPGLRWLIPLAQRPSFTGDGLAEHSEYAIYCWQKDFGGNAEILPHLWVTYAKQQRKARQKKELAQAQMPLGDVPTISVESPSGPEGSPAMESELADRDSCDAAPGTEDGPGAVRVHEDSGTTVG